MLSLEDDNEKHARQRFLHSYSIQKQTFSGRKYDIFFLEMFLDLEREAQGALRFVHQLGSYR
jgi:hypothetical protein